MEDPAATTLPQETSPKETLGRRQLLKAIAATGGAVAASTLLPGEWAKPVVEVGVLPAHAQISETPVPGPTPSPVPLAYSVVCDSNPGGGDISIPQFNGTISEISPFIVVTSGTGPVNGIPVTLSIEMTSPGTPPTFANGSQSTTTATTADGPGRAQFQNVRITAGGQVGQSFFLIFDFATSVGTIQARCGEFTWGPPGA